jgi:hypothetical protein
MIDRAVQMTLMLSTTQHKNRMTRLMLHLINAPLIAPIKDLSLSLLLIKAQTYFDTINLNHNMIDRTVQMTSMLSTTQHKNRMTRLMLHLINAPLIAPIKDLLIASIDDLLIAPNNKCYANCSPILLLHPQVFPSCWALPLHGSILPPRRTLRRSTHLSAYSDQRPRPLPSTFVRVRIGFLAARRLSPMGTQA